MTFLKIYPTYYNRTMLLIPAAIIAMRLASVPTANLSYILAAGYALMGRVQAVQALIIVWLLNLINPGLAPKASFMSVGRFVVFFAAALSLIVHRVQRRMPAKMRSLVTFTVFLWIAVSAHSLLFSIYPSVSITKSSSYFLVFLTLLIAWGSFSPKQHLQAESFVFGIMLLVLLTSLPFYFIQSIGFMRNGTGFQGILNHPQAFGPFVAMIGALLAGQFVEKRKLPLWQIAVLVMVPVLIIASEARTAGGAFVLGLAMSMLVILVFYPLYIRQMLSGLFTARFAFVVWSSIIGLLLLGSLLIMRLEHYVTKSGRVGATDLIAVAEHSRGELVYNMLENIWNHPFSGIGWGIGSIPEAMEIEYDTFFGLPVKAAIEKGVMPIALLEELGVVLYAVFLVWLFMLIRRAAKNGFTYLNVIFTCIFINLGENVFFAPGGAGLLVIILVSWAVAPTFNRPLNAWRGASWNR